MKCLILMFCLIGSVCAADKTPSQIANRIDQIMESLDYSALGAKARARRGEFDKADFKAAIFDLKANLDLLVKVKHKEKLFNLFAKASQKSFNPLVKALKKGELEKVPKLWKAAYKSCQDCHTIYDSHQVLRSKTR